MISHNLNNLELLNIIGKGAFGNVYLGKDKTTKEYYAVKLISKKSLKNSELLEYFNNEVSVLKKIDHPNIIKFKGLFENKDYYYLLTEYCNGGTLCRAMRSYHKNYSKPIKENIARFFIFNILKGIIHLNKNNIIHRDIKSDNILLHYDNDQDLITNNYLKAKVKIIDFGFARFLEKNELAGSLVGTPMYMDPIILNSLIISKKKKLKGFYDIKVDIWSLGILTYELLIGVLPFVGENIEGLFYSIQNRDFVIPKEKKRNFQLSKAALFFIDKCLNIDNNLRPLPLELMNDEWMINQRERKDSEKILNIYEMKNDEEIIEQKQDYKFFSYWKKYLGKTILKIKNISYVDPNIKKNNSIFNQTERLNLPNIRKIINITTCPFKNKTKLANNNNISHSAGLVVLTEKEKKTHCSNKGLLSLNIDLSHQNSRVISGNNNQTNYKKKIPNIINVKKNFKTLQIEKRERTENHFFDFINNKPNLTMNFFGVKHNKNKEKNNNLMNSIQINRERILNNNKYNFLFKEKSFILDSKNYKSDNKNGKNNKNIMTMPVSISIDLYHNMINNTDYGSGNSNHNKNFFPKNLKEYIKSKKKIKIKSKNNKNKDNNINDFLNNKSNNIQQLTITNYKNRIFIMDDKSENMRKIGKRLEIGSPPKTDQNKSCNNKKITFSNKTFPLKRNINFDDKHNKIK